MNLRFALSLNNMFPNYNFSIDHKYLTIHLKLNKLYCYFTSCILNGEKGKCISIYETSILENALNICFLTFNVFSKFVCIQEMVRMDGKGFTII